MKKPILFLIFNRPDTTEQVFESIKKYQPTQLFIAADGPRNEKEYLLCEETRKIINEIDWNCELKTLFRKKNLGCGKAVSSAIDWFFENVDEGIILEDDCLPSPSFFIFCEEMLSLYRDDSRIMMISGSNSATLLPKLKSDYFYSNVYSIWGWATWRRSWILYDRTMSSWPIQKQKRPLVKMYPNRMIENYFSSAFDDVYNKKIDTWDYQWVYTCIINNGLNIIPKYNMISNIGVVGTHTEKNNNKSLFLKTFNPYNEKKKNLKMPTEIKRDNISDSILLKKSGVSRLFIASIPIKIFKKIKLFILYENN